MVIERVQAGDGRYAVIRVATAFPGPGNWMVGGKEIVYLYVHMRFATSAVMTTIAVFSLMLTRAITLMTDVPISAYNAPVRWCAKLPMCQVIINTKLDVRSTEVTD